MKSSRKCMRANRVREAGCAANSGLFPSFHFCHGRTGDRTLRQEQPPRRSFLRGHRRKTQQLPGAHSAVHTEYFMSKPLKLGDCVRGRPYPTLTVRNACSHPGWRIPRVQMQTAQRWTRIWRTHSHAVRQNVESSACFWKPYPAFATNMSC